MSTAQPVNTLTNIADTAYRQLTSPNVASSGGDSSRKMAESEKSLSPSVCARPRSSVPPGASARSDSRLGAGSQPTAAHSSLLGGGGQYQFVGMLGCELRCALPIGHQPAVVSGQGCGLSMGSFALARR